MRKLWIFKTISHVQRNGSKPVPFGSAICGTEPVKPTQLIIIDVELSSYLFCHVPDIYIVRIGFIVYFHSVFIIHVVDHSDVVDQSNTMI